MKEIIEILIGIGCVFLVGFLISLYNNMVRLKNLKKKIAKWDSPVIKKRGKCGTAWLCNV